jgi:O-antigen ligase
LVWRAQSHENLFALKIPAEQRLADGAALRTDLIVALIAAFLLQALYAALAERYDLNPTVYRALGVAAVVAVLVGAGALTYVVLDEQRESGGITSAFTEGLGAKKDAGVNERLTSLSSNSRSAYWGVAWEEWKEHPLTGTGAGTFHYTWLENRPSFSSVRQVHNVYLEQGTETGVFAFLALSGFAALLGLYLVWATWKASGDRRLLLAGLTAATGAYLLHSALEWHWYIPPSTLFFFVLAGVAVKLASETEWDAEKNDRGRIDAEG